MVKVFNIVEFIHETETKVFEQIGRGGTESTRQIEHIILVALQYAMAQGYDHCLKTVKKK